MYIYDTCELCACVSGWLLLLLLPCALSLGAAAAACGRFWRSRSHRPARRPPPPTQNSTVVIDAIYEDVDELEAVIDGIAEEQFQQQRLEMGSSGGADGAAGAGGGGGGAAATMEQLERGGGGLQTRK